MLQSDKLILTAMTVEMHTKGSKYIDELMQLTNMLLPGTFDDGNIFKQNEWKVLEDDVHALGSIVVKIQVPVYGLQTAYAKNVNVLRIQSIFRKNGKT